MHFNPIRFGTATPTQRAAATAVKFGLNEVVLTGELLGRTSSGKGQTVSLKAGDKVQILTKASYKDGVPEAIVMLPGRDGLSMRTSPEAVAAATQ